MSEKGRVLLVEDDSHVRYATARLLEGAGYEVSEAQTGNEGLRLAQEQKPDLVLLDVALPDIDGFEVCQRIKEEPALAGCFVILASGVRTESDGQGEGLEAGADGYIARPISSRELLARVGVMVRFKQAEAALRQSNARLAALNRLTMALSSMTSMGSQQYGSPADMLDMLLYESVAHTVEALGLDGGALCLLDETGENLELAASLGVSEAFAVTAGRLRTAGNCLAQTVADCEVLVVADDRCLPQPLARASRAEGWAAQICVPLVAELRSLGVIVVGSRSQRDLGSEERHMMRTFGQQIGMAIRSTRVRTELIRNEQRHQAISEVISDYAYAARVEPDGSLVLEWMVGAFARITGYTSEEVETRVGLASLVHPDDLSVVVQSVENLRVGQSDVTEFRLVTKSGEVCWVRAYSRPIWDETKGRVVRIYGAAQDITERKRAEERTRQQLEELQR